MSASLHSGMFWDIVKRLRALGYADADIAWAENIEPPKTPEDFALEIVFVICNSGMQNKVARRIYENVSGALQAGHRIEFVFKHRGKTSAINDIWTRRAKLFRLYNAVPGDKLAFIETLPWIGPVTKYHVAKNFGLQLAKPDVHLSRLASTLGTTPQLLCEEIAAATGLKVATVDTLLWRAAAVGVLDTRTGLIK